MNGLRAIMVSVDYSDLLSLTLPYNRHHFADVMVVTAPEDETTLRVAADNRCRTHVTRAFYEDGAFFNKFRALEEGLDAYGREGWLCVMDSDVLWPKGVEVKPGDGEGLILSLGADVLRLERGYLATPLRRMREDVTGLTAETLPPESEWVRYPVHRNVAEWAGYSQVFHASDPYLPRPPWHDVTWRHAGGADSFFQMMWPAQRKVRPSWEVLHLGPAGTNWMGRASPYVDGTCHAEAATRHGRLGQTIRERRRTRSYDAEKLRRR